MRHNHLPSSFVSIAVAALVLLTGCSLPRYASVNSESKAKFDLGQSPTIVVTQAENGRRNSQDLVVDQLIAQSRRNGYPTVVNRLSEGIRFELKNGAVAGSNRPAANEYFLKFELLDNSIEDAQEQRAVDILGTKTTNVDIVVAKFGVSFTLAGKDVVIEQKEIDGRRQWDKANKPKERSEMLDAALNDAVSQFLTLITPVKARSLVRLDDSEESMKDAVKIAAKDEYKAALDLFMKHLDKNPNSAPTLYNVAVMHDAMGNYDEALAFYEKAEKVAMKPLYSESKAQCSARKFNRR